LKVLRKFEEYTEDFKAGAGWLEGLEELGRWSREARPCALVDTFAKLIAVSKEVNEVSFVKVSVIEGEVTQGVERQHMTWANAVDEQ
jgi:hypothetical protein